MNVAGETTTFSGLITRAGRTDPYRFEFVRNAGTDEHLLLYRKEGDRWQLLSSSHGRAERDFLWQRYGLYANRDELENADAE